MSSKRKFIIDCDVGTDDAQAIFMALAQPDIEVLALTTVFGNASIECTSYNALRTLHMAERTDIPVYVGCSSSMLNVPSQSDGYHGKDGLGDFTEENPPDISLLKRSMHAPLALVQLIPIYPGCRNKLLSTEPYKGDAFMGTDGLGDAQHEIQPDKSLIKQEHACVIITQLANECPGEISLVATGPLTNIAVALKLDPNLGQKLQGFYVMGGNTTGKGNKTMTAEFNFYSDPEATHTVLSGLTGCPITLIGLEICDKAAFSWEEYEEITNIPGKTADFIRRCEASMNARQKALGDKKYMAMWDQLAMAVAIDNKVAVEMKDIYMMIELQGEVTRGQCVVDWLKRLGKAANVRLVTNVDKTRFKQLVTQGIKYGSTSKM